MTKDEALTEVYKSEEIRQVMLKIQPEHLRDDLKQHVFLLLLEKPDGFVESLIGEGKLRNYIVKVICQLVNFKEDKFHRVARRGTEILTDFSIVYEEAEEDFTQSQIQRRFTEIEQNDEAERQARELEQSCALELGKVYWYNQALLKLYIDLGSYRAVSEQTGIPTKSVFNAIQIAKNQIKTNVLCQN